ncbi:hypothetical protein NDU88_006086 [Pleurodeles waltl]|uniref:Secreted protein n=1 Tax=Pleurodeles waltl TaxID=8319 RepID=A0AAV7TW69_PLEWA|nr:hypothetical protein NDU88_006086 [Pleurodeles waltl]
MQVSALLFSTLYPFLFFCRGGARRSVPAVQASLTLLCQAARFCAPTGIGVAGLRSQPVARAVHQPQVPPRSLRARWPASASRRVSAMPGCATGSSPAPSAHLRRLLHWDAAVTSSSRRDALGLVRCPSQPPPRSRLRPGPDRADGDMHSSRPARWCAPDHGAPDTPRLELKCPGIGYFSGSLRAVSGLLC